jgi:hypothetical protein
MKNDCATLLLLLPAPLFVVSDAVSLAQQWPEHRATLRGIGWLAGSFAQETFVLIS